MSRKLIVGDIHNPVSHPGYLPFCQDLYAKYRCDSVILIGDVVDWAAITFHARHPEAAGAKDEYELAKDETAKWYNVFKKADVCIGNHDERVVRVAADAGIPEFLIKNYQEVWETPGWTWKTEFIYDDVFYFHGTGSGGIHPAFTSMQKRLMSVVQGHIHSAAGIKWRASPQRRTFGMDTGCGIDDKAIAFAYGRHNAVRSILSAGVMIDGIPYHEVMPIGEGEKYHRSKFKGIALHEKRLTAKTRRRIREILHPARTLR